MSVSDGGLYDNRGLKPVERVNTVLVSDGGRRSSPLSPGACSAGSRHTWTSAASKPAPFGSACSLPSSSIANAMAPGSAAPSAATAPTLWKATATGLASGTIAQIRTDMDAFSDAEIDVLSNNGYLLANTAIQVHAPFLVSKEAGRAEPPFPELKDARFAAP